MKLEGVKGLKYQTLTKLHIRKSEKSNFGSNKICVR